MEVTEIQWEGKKVTLLLPVYRSFNADTHFTLFANYAKYGPEKIGMMVEKATVIHECRNILTHKFMNNSDSEWAIMVDDDMILPSGNEALFNGRYRAGVPPENAKLNAISRLMSHPKEAGIVGCLYFGRHPKGKAQNSRAFGDSSENERFRSLQHKGLIPCEWVGTGMIRFHRNHILALKKAIDGGEWPECMPPREDRWYGYFNPTRTGVGEDVSFCLRARKLGIPVHVDASLICLHAGDMLYGPANTSK